MGFPSEENKSNDSSDSSESQDENENNEDGDNFGRINLTKEDEALNQEDGAPEEAETDKDKRRKNIMEEYKQKRNRKLCVVNMSNRGEQK